MRPNGDSGYLDELTKAISRSGFSWRVVREKWDAFRRAFDGFNLDRVAAYEGADLARLFNDPGIVRNRRKIMETVENARLVRWCSMSKFGFRVVWARIAIWRSCRYQSA